MSSKWHSKIIAQSTPSNNCVLPSQKTTTTTTTTNDTHPPEFIQRTFLGFWTGALGRGPVTQSGAKCWFICKKINFHSIIDLSFICYRLQLPCLDQIEKDFRIITLHFLFSLLLVNLEQLINE